MKVKDVGPGRTRRQELRTSPTASTASRPSAWRIFLLPDANAIETADAVKEKMEELSQDFPPGIIYEVGYDTSPFIRESINEVFKSLRDSIILVAIVVLVFLQTWRAALIPLAAVPVAIVGTFAAMAAAGFTINNLTLFGLVLAVGIVVDDAIVVVEAVQHQLEMGFAPREATIRAMDEVAGPIIAVGRGAVGGVHPVRVPLRHRRRVLPPVRPDHRRQHADLDVQLAHAQPGPVRASCCKPPTPADYKPAPLGRVVGIAAVPADALRPLFNRAFAWSGGAYVKVVGLRACACRCWCWSGTPGDRRRGRRGVPPAADRVHPAAGQGLPDRQHPAARRRRAERTREVMSKISRIALDTRSSSGRGRTPSRENDDGAWVRKVRPVKHVNAVAGNSFVLSAYGSNFGSMFIILDDFDEPARDEAERRRDRGGAAEAVRRGDARRRRCNVFGAPAVSGLGRAGGFRLMIEDRGDVGPDDAPGTDRQRSSRRRTSSRRWSGCSRVFKTNSPQTVPRRGPGGVPGPRRSMSATCTPTLQGTMGSRYVNDFNRFGRTWQVNVQADRPVPQPARGREAAEGAEPARRDGAAGGGARR